MKHWKSGEFDRDKLHSSLHVFTPTHAIDSLEEVDLDELWGRGKRLILLDVDHTLVKWKAEEFAPSVLLWIAKAKQLGFDLCILSNTRHPERLERLSKQLDILTVRGRMKPSRAMFRLALIRFKCHADQAVMIGDQLMTDILGANRSGIDAIWVKKMDGPEFAGTRINRFIEKQLSSQIYRALVLPESADAPSRTLLQQLVRFVIVGGTSFVIDTALTTLFMRGVQIGGKPAELAVGQWVISHAPWIESYVNTPEKASAPLLGGLASFIAMGNSFIWNRTWTFEARGKESKSLQIQRFYTVSILGAILNAGIFSFFYNILAGHTIIIPKIISAGIVAIWNFAGQRFYAFRPRGK